MAHRIDITNRNPADTLYGPTIVRELVASNNHTANGFDLVADCVEAIVKLSEKHDDDIQKLQQRIADLERLLILKDIDREQGYDVD